MTRPRGGGSERGRWPGEGLQGDAGHALSKREKAERKGRVASGKGQLSGRSEQEQYVEEGGAASLRQDVGFGRR